MSSADKSAERSSIEIKDLLRKLHPDRGNHKDRIRRLNKFRNYLMPHAATVRLVLYDNVLYDIIVVVFLLLY